MTPEYVLDLADLLKPLFPAFQHPDERVASRRQSFTHAVKGVSVIEISSIIQMEDEEKFRYALVTDLHRRFKDGPLMELAQYVRNACGASEKLDGVIRKLDEVCGAHTETGIRVTQPQNASVTPDALNTQAPDDGMIWGDFVHVAYFRIPEMGTWTGDRIAEAVQTLREIVETVRCRSREVSSHSSVYGRLIVTRINAAKTVDFSVEVIAAAADRGLVLAGGIACGRVERIQDLETGNVAGTAVNYAARLAHLENGAGTLNVDEGTYKDATSAYARFNDAFGPLQTGKVKATELRFHRYKGLPRGGAATEAPLPTLPADTYVSETAYAVVYDIEGFSRMTRREMVRAAEETTRCVSFALDAAGGNRLSGSKGQICHAPAGDGGVLVFRPKQQSPLRATWTFVKELANRSAGAVNLRIGAAVGPIVIVGNAWPIGPAIFEADRLSAFPAAGAICVDRRFWESLENDEFTGGWTSGPCTDDREGLLLSPPSYTPPYITPGLQHSTVIGKSIQPGLVRSTALERIHKIFPSINPGLVGRENELGTITASLQNCGHTIVCLKAIGGMGKTALAKKWCIDHLADYDEIVGARLSDREFLIRTDGPEERLARVNNDSNLVVRELLREVGQQLGIVSARGNDVYEAAIVEKLGNSRTLFLVDNLEVNRDARELIASLLRICQVPTRTALVTTRVLPDFSTNAVEVCDLKALSPKASRSLLENWFHRRGSDLDTSPSEEVYSAILHIAHGHPLALELLAGKLLTSNEDAILTLLEKWEEHSEDASMATLLSFIFDETFNKFIGEPGVELLRLIADEMQAEEGPLLRAFEGQRKEFSESLQKLFDAGCIYRKTIENRKVLSMHPLTRAHFSGIIE